MSPRTDRRANEASIDMIAGTATGRDAMLVLGSTTDSNILLPPSADPERPERRPVAQFGTIQSQVGWGGTGIALLGGRSRYARLAIPQFYQLSYSVVLNWRTVLPSYRRELPTTSRIQTVQSLWVPTDISAKMSCWPSAGAGEDLPNDKW